MNKNPLGPDKKFNRVKLAFPFKYDLGGYIINFENAEEKLKAMHPNLQIDERSLENFNLSYLSIREPILTLDSQEITLILDGKEYLFNQTIKLYPGQGVISIILSTELENISAFELIDFYKLFYKEKNRDYIPYLKQHGCATKALAKSIKDETEAPQLKFGQVADELRELLKPFLKSRPHTYYFHDYRTLFLIFDDFSEQDISQRLAELYTLLKLTKTSSQPTSEIKSVIDQFTVTYENKFILSGDWTSVFLLNGDVKFGEDIVTLFDLSHTFWYICQTWIFALHHISTEELVNISNLMAIEEIDQTTYEKTDEVALRLHDYIVSVHESLIEVKNIDLMLKNPEFCKIMRKFYGSMGVAAQIKLAEDNLSILDGYYQRLKDSMAQKLRFTTQKQSTKAASRMQILNLIFSGAVGLSAAMLMEGATIPGTDIVITGWLPLAIGLMLWILIAALGIKVTRIILKKTGIWR